MSWSTFPPRRAEDYRAFGGISIQHLAPRLHVYYPALFSWSMRRPTLWATWCRWLGCKRAKLSWVLPMHGSARYEYQNCARLIFNPVQYNWRMNQIHSVDIISDSPCGWSDWYGIRKYNWKIRPPVPIKCMWFGTDQHDGDGGADVLMGRIMVWSSPMIKPWSKSYLGPTASINTPNGQSKRTLNDLPKQPNRMSQVSSRITKP